MQIILYNPLTAWAPDRLEQISNESIKIDVVILVATADRAYEDYTIQANTTYHTVYKHGWIKGKAGEQTETNRACGITFLVKKSLTTAVKQHIQPPKEHRGRIAGIRLRTATDDVTVIAVYAPCYGTGTW